MVEENSEDNPSKKGFNYEELCKLLIISKCISEIDYNNVKSGYISSLIKFKNFESIIDTTIHSGNNIADIILEDSENTIIIISVKYSDNQQMKTTDIDNIKNTLNDNTSNFKVDLIVKDKNIIDIMIL